jgi:CysZ protein
MGAPWRGLQVISANQPLWPFAIAPALVTGLMLAGAFFLAITSAAPVTRWLLPGLVRWWILFLLARSAMLLLLLLLLGALGMMLSALLCLPLHDALSQRVEALQGALPAPLSFREALPSSILHSILGISLWIGAELALTPLQLIPGLGTLLELVLGFAVTAFFLGHQLLDGPMSRRQMSFAEKLTWMRAHLSSVLGLGSMGTLMIAVPFLNAIGLPIAITGGTLLFLELETES